MSWFKVVTGIKAILVTFKDLLVTVLLYVRHKQQVHEMEQLHEAVKEAQDANTLEKKADAACKIEKALNPDSSCDH